MTAKNEELKREESSHFENNASLLHIFVRIFVIPLQEVQCPTCGLVSKARLKEQSVVIALHPPRRVRAVRNITRWMEQGTYWVLVQKKE